MDSLEARKERAAYLARTTDWEQGRIAREVGLSRDSIKRTVRRERGQDPNRGGASQAQEVEINIPKGRGEAPPREPRPTQRALAILSEQEKKFDERATRDDCVEDLRRLQEESPLSYINRNMYRHLGRYSDATWNQHFGTFLEFRRQAGLELSRYQHAHEKHIAKHASLDHYRLFYRRQIEPIQMLYPRCPKKRINTIACISDNHDRQMDPFVWRVYLETVKLLQPDVQLFNGDQGDLYEFNRYGIDPRVADAVSALTYIRDTIFKQAREAAPDSEIVWNLGNHEMRIQKHMADASPYLRSVLGDFHGWTWADLFGVRDLNINVNCKWDLAAFNKYDVVEQVKNNWLVLWETFAAMHTHDDKFGLSGTSGHTHKARITTTANVAKRGVRSPINWTVTPSACRGNADYAEGLDKTDQGFAIFHVMPDRGIVIPEMVLIQGDFAAVAGNYYYRRPDEVYSPNQTSWE